MLLTISQLFPEEIAGINQWKTDQPQNLHLVVFNHLLCQTYCQDHKEVAKVNSEIKASISSTSLLMGGLLMN